MQTNTSQKKRFSVKDFFFSKCEQIRRKVTVQFFIFAKEIFRRKLHFLESQISKDLFFANISYVETYLGHLKASKMARFANFPS